MYSYATVQVNVVRLNHTPVAVDDSFSGLEDVPFQIGFGQLLANDADPDTPYTGEQLTVTSVGGATHGTVSMGAGSVTFVPDAEYSGPAQFGYVVSDDNGGSTSATAYLTVNAVNDAPVFDGVYYDPNPDSGVWIPGTEAHDPEYLIADIPGQQNGSVYAHDIDSPGGLTFSLAAGPTHGHASMGADGSWLYQSEVVDPYRGSDPFWVRATDSGGASALVQVAATHDHMTPVPIIGGGGSGGGDPGGGGGGPGNGSEPIVIDLQGDGLRLLSPTDSTMRIDTDGDGTAEQIGWAAPEEAVLAYDANRSGHVDALDEVRFTGYLPGAKTDLEGLRAFDSNGDGKLDANDDKWADFGLLQTPAGATALEQGVFTPITQTEVVGIGLERQGQPSINAGNIVYGTAPVALADGSQLQAFDVRFSAITPAEQAVSTVSTAPVPVDVPPVADFVPASQAQIAAAALLLNSWANAASAPREDAPLAFVPSHAAHEMVLSAPASAIEAANEPAVLSSPRAVETAPAVAVG
ncbi:MAG: hypothetical protein EOO54_19925 [Haliea sp.]|nr:MAG: hypothetical protein EOO54_19925 [Haliea sp.]